MRQGCCLSAILFSLAVAPFARAIKHVLRVSLRLVRTYLDDFAMAIDRIFDNIGKFVQLLEGFGTCSGLIANWSKTMIIPLWELPDGHLLSYAVQSIF